MNWKSILPPGIDINVLTLDECRNFKKFHELWGSIHNVSDCTIV